MLPDDLALTDQNKPSCGASTFEAAVPVNNPQKQLAYLCLQLNSTWNWPFNSLNSKKKSIENSELGPLNCHVCPAESDCALKSRPEHVKLVAHGDMIVITYRKYYRCPFDW